MGTYTDAVLRHGTITAAADALGIPRRTFGGRLQRERREARQAPPPAEPIIDKPRVRVSTGGEIRVLAIGDVHAGPGMPTKHLGWIAKHAIETQPTHVVQIGDFGDWASCSFHEANDTVKGRLKPSFHADEDAVHAAYEALYGPMERAGLKALRFETAGNHCHRVDRFVNANPELVGDWDIRLRQMPARFGVDRREYGEWLFLGGVGFIHHPANFLGRAYGGKYPENTIANDATFSIVWGHSHKSNVVHRPKIGPHDNRVTILNLGTAMPPNYVPPYAQWSTTGWSYGVFDLSISAGKITDHSFISINELGRRYG